MHRLANAIQIIAIMKILERTAHNTSHQLSPQAVRQKDAYSGNIGQRFRSISAAHSDLLGHPAFHVPFAPQYWLSDCE
jgi:hypothetical protein